LITHPYPSKEGTFLSKRKVWLQEYVLKLLSNVTVIPNFVISRPALQQAYQLCYEIDEKDTVYVAVAIEFGMTLITNDKKLYEGLKARHFSNVALLQDIVEQLRPREG
jgi:predicted nucleic acid-binding protein